MSTTTDDGNEASVGCTCKLLPVVQNLAEKYKNCIGASESGIGQKSSSLQKRKCSSRKISQITMSESDSVSGDSVLQMRRNSTVSRAGSHMIRVPNHDCPLHSKTFVSNVKLLPFFKFGGSENSLTSNIGSMMNYWSCRMNCNRPCNIENPKNNNGEKPRGSSCEHQASACPSQSACQSGSSLSDLEGGGQGRLSRILHKVKNKKSIVIVLSGSSIAALVALVAVGVYFLRKRHHHEPRCGLAYDLWDVFQKFVRVVFE